MKFKNPYMKTVEKINLLERWILFHSYIYYELNENIVDDSVYDHNAQQLLEYKNSNFKIFKESKYYNLFYDYDGSTGMHLIDRIFDDEELYEKIKFDAKINFLKR